MVRRADDPVARPRDDEHDPAGDPQGFDFTLTGGPSALDQSFGLTDAAAAHDSGEVLPGAGYQAAEMGDIKEGDTVVVFGAGPVGIFAAKSAWLFGAGRVIVVDEVDYRLEFVKKSRLPP